MLELTVGQKVICKHKNGRYYQCDVVQLTKETFYEVNFDDGSFSDNLFPEDIVVGGHMMKYIVYQEILMYIICMIYNVFLFEILPSSIINTLKWDLNIIIVFLVNIC